MIKKITAIVWLLIGVMAFSQDFIPWTGKYQLSFDPENPRSFLIEIVPDNDGKSYLGQGSAFELVLDKNLDQSQFVFENVGTNNTTGTWSWNMLSDGMLFPEEECGAFWNLGLTENTNYNTPMTVTAGVPIPFVRVTYNGPEECIVGTGARFYEYIKDIYEDDICPAYAGSGLSNSLQVWSNTNALTGIITDSTNPLLCLEEEFCFKEANTAGDVLNTEVGISTLGRDAFNGEWPQNRQGAWIALESNEKAFIPTRATTAQIDAITDPVIGMMVYSTDEKCLKINTDGTQAGWHCFTAPACEEDMD